MTLLPTKLSTTLDFIRFEGIRNLKRPKLMLWMLLELKPASLFVSAIDTLLRPKTPVAKALSERRRVYLRELMHDIFGIFLDGEVPTDLLSGDYTQIPGFFKGVTEAIDAGATIGDFSLFLVLRNRVAHVTAFEPNPSSFKYLVRNIQSNGCVTSVTPINHGVSDKSGEEVFSTRQEYFVPRNHGPSQQTAVECVRIDDLHFPSPLDLIKIDVEGSEDKALKGAVQTLRRFKPRLIIEVHTQEKMMRVMSVLLPLGYQLAHEKINQVNPRVSVLYLR